MLAGVRRIEEHGLDTGTRHRPQRLPHAWHGERAVDLRDEAGAEREDLQGSGCRCHGRSANNCLPERLSLQRLDRFMVCTAKGRSGSSCPDRKARKFQNGADGGNRKG